MQKEIYQTPEMEVVTFENEDVITTSNEQGEGGFGRSNDSIWQ